MGYIAPERILAMNKTTTVANDQKSDLYRYDDDLLNSFFKTIANVCVVFVITLVP